MKPFVKLLAVLTASFSQLHGPSIFRKSSSDMATLSGTTIKPLMKGKAFPVSVTATFHVNGYYQFYAYIEDSGGNAVWNCGSISPVKRGEGKVVTISGSFPASLQSSQMSLNIKVYCTTGDYSGFELSRRADLELIDSRQYIDIPDGTRVTFPGSYYYWRDGLLQSSQETLDVPILNRNVVDPEVNHLEIIDPLMYFTYLNPASSNIYGGTPSVELWLLNHFEDFARGSYSPSATPVRRSFSLAITKKAMGKFYFGSSSSLVYDRRNLQMLNTAQTVSGASFASTLFFIPTGFGRHAPEEEPYRWRLILKDFTIAGHYIEFNGSFKRNKEDMGYAIHSHYYVHVD